MANLTTDDAVERAARAWHDAAERGSEGGMGSWESLDPDDRARALRFMAAALAAAGVGAEVGREALRSVVTPALQAVEDESARHGVSAGIGMLSDAAVDALLPTLAARGDS